MPKRTDLKKILIIGSGPIVIGQACEFDYSGTQACKALREEGYEVVLVNSNPATIMTDPEMADRTYIEPITWEYVAEIIRIERPDALLPTLGGQTGLNTAMALHQKGVLKEYGVEMIGAKPGAIHKAEDRLAFKQAMEKIGLDLPKSGQVHNMDEARAIIDQVGLPCVLRPSFTLGGTGGGIAYNRNEYMEMIARGLDLSPVHSVLVEESALGWKEYELEVMRDQADNVVIICSIENLDPMGVHTGDSITVAPAQTLTDKEYQRMRDAAIRVIREIGVETGGSNIQFAINPENGRMIVIEMNPRVSRSSALASKATGFPIAKIAAKLAVGYRLDELKNDITRETPACFEPTIDYVVTKVPRWAFEKFPDADATLTTQMKSVGETMAIGRTFKESLQKALRGLETGSFGLGCDRKDRWGTDQQPTREEIDHRLVTPNSERIWFLRYAMKAGMSLAEIHRKTKIDYWFLHHIAEIVIMENQIRETSLERIDQSLLRKAKQYGFSDRQLSHLWHVSEISVREKRRDWVIEPTYKLVDTCAAEFEAYTPYYYSTYDEPPRQVGGEPLSENEVKPKGDKPRIMILGGGPNRIGQGIEFDYCCCQASFALKAAGYETIMVNSNPETVSTDYDTSDLLFFEPLTAEDVLHIVDKVQPDGIIVQFGGQTPLNLAKALEAANAPIIGTSVDSIDVAEDRERFSQLVDDLGLKQPPSGIAFDTSEALRVAQRIGYPVLVRPSYVLGGRAMEIVGDDEGLERYVARAVDVSPGKPILIDRFLDNAVEVDVDCVSDGETALVGGVMQHIEEAGIHSGDSACVLPPYSLTPSIVDEIKRQTRALALVLKVKGLMNVQFAVANFKTFNSGDSMLGQSPVVYILEVNPRASRTAPFVSKAIGIPLPKVASLVMVGKTLEELGITEEVTPKYFSVKESVFPFNKFPGVDIILGPEMKSTGEVMGIDEDFAMAFAKSQIAANSPLPKSGAVFISVADQDKNQVAEVAAGFAKLGYTLFATSGTRKVIAAAGVKCQEIHKISTGRPNLLDLMQNDRVALIINTPSGRVSRSDERKIRSAAVGRGVSCITTMAAAQAAVAACKSLHGSEVRVKPIQERLGKPLPFNSNCTTAGSREATRT
jgi:carbamoyl-phosphate synthase large subunit